MTLTQLHLIDSIKGKTKEKLEEFGILIFTLVSEMEDKTVLDILESILD
ncbi:ATP-dependent DNA helicase PcrA, partial [human gut metagenome]